MFQPSSHKLLASRDVVFHENVDKSVQINDTIVWNIFNDNDNHIKIDAIIQWDQQQIQGQVQELGERTMNTSRISDTSYDEYTTKDIRIMDKSPICIVVPRR